MIRATVCNLRTPNWQEVDRRVLLGLHEDSRTHFTITPWQRGDGHRSFLAHSPDGDIYAIFLRRV